MEGEGGWWGQCLVIRVCSLCVPGSGVTSPHVYKLLIAGIIVFEKQVFDATLANDSLDEWFVLNRLFLIMRNSNQTNCT